MQIILTFDLHAIPVVKGNRARYRPYTKITRELNEIGFEKETKKGYPLPQNTYIKKVSSGSKVTTVRQSEAKKVMEVIYKNWPDKYTTIYLTVGKYWASKRK